MRKRTNRVEIKLNDSEYAHLNNLVHASNLSRESYLRMCINGLVPRPAPSVELVEVTQVLRQIAESINGIFQNAFMHKMVLMNQCTFIILNCFKIKLTRL